MEILSQQYRRNHAERQRIREELQNNTCPERRMELVSELKRLAREQIELMREMRAEEMRVLEDFLKDFDLL